MKLDKKFLTVWLALGASLAAIYFGAQLLIPKKAAKQHDTSSESQETRAPRQTPSAAQQVAQHRTNPIVETKEFRARLSPQSSALLHYRLLEERYHGDNGAMDLVNTDKEEYLPLAFAFKDGPKIADEIPTVQQLSESAVRFSWNSDKLHVVRKLEAGSQPYQLWSTFRVHNRSDKAQRLILRTGTFHYVRRSDEAGGMFAVRSPSTSQALCFANNEVQRKDREDLLQPHAYKGNIGFVATENVYFVSAISPQQPAARRCIMQSSDRGGTPDEPHGSLFEGYVEYPEVVLKPGQSTSYRELAYVGPKSHEALNAAGHHLSKVIDLGFFSQIAGYLSRLLSLIQSKVGNWGIAIILLTFLVKLVLFPLTTQSFRSMARMRLLKPDLDRINELYKDDREKKGAATMELYRKHKINPLGGCLPQLLQLPVWWALYTSLSTTVELYNAEFALWWTDLSAPDPYYVLPVALGALMYVQQKITPTAMDPTQAKVMLYMMPAMMTTFMLFLPSGLCLYILTNSILSIGQQKYFEHAASKSSSEPPLATLNTVTASAGVSGLGTNQSKTSHRKSTQRRSRRGRSKA